MKPFSQIRNESGQTITASLVALAIAGIVIMITLNTINEQSKSLKYFEQKSDTIELKLGLTQTLSSSNICSWQLLALGQKLNVNEIEKQVINLNQIYGGTDNTSPVIAKVGDKISKDPAFTIKSLQMKGFAPAGPGRYTGFLEVAFNQSASDRPIAPIKVKQSITVNTAETPTAQSVLGCSNSPEDEGESCAMQKVLNPDRMAEIVKKYNFQSQWESLYRGVGFTIVADLMSAQMKSDYAKAIDKYGVWVPALKNRELQNSYYFPSGTWPGETAYQAFLRTSTNSPDKAANSDVLFQCVNGKTMWLTSPSKYEAPPPESSGGD